LLLVKNVVQPQGEEIIQSALLKANNWIIFVIFDSDLLVILKCLAFARCPMHHHPVNPNLRNGRPPFYSPQLQSVTQ
jgi:hypothetical protein